MNLTDCDTNIVVATTTTNASGFYEFVVCPGNYSLEFILLDGYVFSPQDQGVDDTVDSDADPVTGETICTTLEEDEYDSTWDAGMFVADPSIDIEKFTNGVDADTPPGPNVTIGDPVEWKYIVNNTGNVEITNIIVTDDQGVNVTCPKDTLAPGESMTCTAQGTAEEGQYANNGTVVGLYGLTLVDDVDPSHYFGSAGEEEPVPTAIPLMVVGLLGIAVVAFMRREQNKK